MLLTTPELARFHVPLFLAAFRELLLVDLQLKTGGFAKVLAALKNAKPGEDVAAHGRDEICHAVDVGCVLYFKEVRCLQRSAAVVRLLRQHGYPAQLVTGVRQWPFAAHAWVELSGRLVSDKPHVTAGFTVIDRC